MYEKNEKNGYIYLYYNYLFCTNVVIFVSQNYNYTLEIPKNVYIVPRCLNFISHFEKKKKKNDDVIFFDKDTRNNHLSNENHVILAKQIFDFFIDDKIPEPTTFKNNFYEVQ